MKYSTLAVALLLTARLTISALPAHGAGFSPTSEPAFQLDYRSPTADKPQSKLWFMDSCWWALLPRASGPSLWQRTDHGWEEQAAIADALRGMPGRADVWPDEAGVTAVAVGELNKTNPSLRVFRLTRKNADVGERWDAKTLAELLPPTAEDLMETATLVRDTSGTWWVAAVAGVKVCVWTSPSEGITWSGPTVLAEGVAIDDICVVTPLPGGEVGIIWSDQIREGFLMRTHADGAALADWRVESVIQMGGRAADDHLNTALSPDGTLWLASKNEVDEAEKPQFTLHAKRVGGDWKSWSYGVRTESTRPSRPIVVSNADGSVVLTGYGDNDRALPAPHDARIVFARVNPDRPDAVDVPRTVIAPNPALNSIIQNVTGPRAPFPAGAPWIVLASDQEGRVYEADLRTAFSDIAGGEQ